jgi:Holliday junction resolvase
MAIIVVKRNGRVELFDKNKIVKTCLRAGVSKDIAVKIANEIEKRAYDGITTDKILSLIIEMLEKYVFSRAARYDLKMALFRLGPEGYAFERFVARLLKEYGYDVKTNVILTGMCATHEIDVLARKSRKVYIIECKFHNSPGIYTGLKEALYTYARFLDLTEGGYCKIDNVWLFTNTKFSEEAKKFACCRKMLITGWRYPKKESIEKMLEKKRLYPITCVRSLKREEKDALISCNVVFCRDIIKANLEHLSSVSGIELKRLEEIENEARDIVYS